MYRKLDRHGAEAPACCRMCCAASKICIDLRSGDEHWQEKLDSFLQFNQRAILEHSGKISMEQAKRLALEQYQTFNKRQIEEGDALAEKEFEEEVKRMLPKGGEDGK